MTRRERLESKVEKREAWAEKARDRSAARFEGARRIADQIPLGQPILVGHHSEKRHRRAVARIDSNMRHGIEEQRLAAHHESKAAGLADALERSVFSDDTDAIEALEARIAEHEAERDRMKSINAAIRQGPGWSDRIVPPLTERERADLLRLAQFGTSSKPGYPAYALTNLGARIRTDRERIEEIRRQQAAQAEADAAPNGVVLTEAASSEYCTVRFAEKPARAILDALREAKFRWSRGVWAGRRADLPTQVSDLLHA